MINMISPAYQWENGRLQAALDVKHLVIRVNHVLQRVQAL